MAEMTPAMKELLDMFAQAVAEGELDDKLDVLQTIIRARKGFLEDMQTSAKLRNLELGDTVRFNHRVTPKYLQGERGTVLRIEHSGSKTLVVIAMARIVRNYGRSETRCPPEILEKVNT